MIDKDRWSNFVMAIVGGVIGAIVAGSGLPGRLWSTATAQAATRHHVRALEAERFVLVDQMGIKRAELAMVHGEPLLDFYGPTGKTERVSIGVDMKGTARARFYSSTGISQAALGVTGEGRAGMALLDRLQHLRGTFDVAIGGEPTLRLYDEKGARLGLDITEAGSPGFALLDSNGKTRAAIVLSTNNNPSLTLYGADGKPIKSLP
ncbi:MAG TPA: hypothetical protein VNE82_15870 [Candidatus Binataceae bacterium]|nr:hypothetical protein [Candidatus Binataceae bacterium]